VIRSNYLIVAAIIVALCLGVSSAMAQPMDQGPIVKHPATANVYVPPADLFAPPASAPPRPVSARTESDSSPWQAIGLATGGVVLVCACAIGIRRTRGPRRPVG
jgi:hypothetical protein